MADFLADVAENTRQRLLVQKERMPLAELKKIHAPRAGSSTFKKALEHPGRLALIAELKQASPSVGLIRKETDIAARVKAYERGGAAVLSILTEEDFFQGSIEFLRDVRRLSSLPLLRKDFILDPYQIVESKALGADAVLLITSLLPGGLLAEFIAQCTQVGLDALVEVHDEQDLETALAAHASIIGINNRDLRTLRVDTTTAERLLRIAKRPEILFVVESGIRDPKELPRLRTLGAHGVLIGETLMRSEFPEKLVKEFVRACRK